MNPETRSNLRLAFAAGVLTSATAISLDRLVQAGPWVGSCLLVVLVVTGVGHGARVLRAHWSVTVLAQVVAAVATVTVLLAPKQAVGLFIPGPGALRAINDLIVYGQGDITRESPPALATPGITAILVVFCAGFALLIDIVAVTARRAVLVGLPVLVVYLVPATRRPGGFTWLAFLVCAAAYLSLVSAEGQTRIERWGRTLGVNPANRPAGPANSHGAVSRRVTAVAVSAAIVLPWFVPTLPGLFSGGGGPGAGGATVVVNTTVDLRSALSGSTAIPLLRYTTNATDPRDEYLRMSVDDTFDGNAWTSSPPGPLRPFTTNPPQVPGLTAKNVAQAPVKTVVTVVGNLAYQTVPAPYAPLLVTNIVSPAYDPNTLVVLAGDSPTRSRIGQQYTVQSDDITPTSAQLNAATGAVDPDLDNYLKLPASFPADVKSLALRITAGDTTPFQKAESLQAYFLENFTYSLSVPVGDGNTAIERFLQTKEGFCQQFAGTMAAMARFLGIPAVVAVGFTPGTPQADGSYVVTTHDAHAWPMLYFSGVGWVRFEPTPTIASSGRGTEPPYTVQGSNSKTNGNSAAEQASASAEASAEAARCSSSGQLRKITQTGGCGSDAGAGAQATRAFASWGPFGVLPRWFDSWFLSGSAAQIAIKLLILVFVLLTAIPGLGRIRRRRARRSLVKQAERYLARSAGEPGRRDADDADRANATGSGKRKHRAPNLSNIALAAWDELRDSADDYGYPWYDSDTPRQAAARLSAAARLNQDADAALGRVTRLTEQARYAQTAVLDPPTLHTIPGDLRSVRTALAERATRADRFKAAVLPSSSLARIRDRRDRTAAAVYRSTRRR